MKTLYLCEKPSQAKDIAAVLNINSRKEGYFDNGQDGVTWCVGHLLEMANPDAYDAKYKKWSFDTLPILPDQWRMEVKRTASKQFRVIRKLLTQTQHVVISTDADREGETIAREILDLCQFHGTVSRLWLSALDPHSIRKALAAIFPDHKTRPLYYAGLGRSRADWLMGINLTRAYTLIAKQSGGDRVVSVGRVQTPTLNLVVKRDLEIESFRPVPYYDISIECEVTDSIYSAKWLPEQSVHIEVDAEGRCLNQQQAITVTEQVQHKTGSIVKLEKTIKEEKPPLPFDLSNLQIEASKRFGLDAGDVLKAVQRLYETHKATTYPRTDCQYLPQSQHQEASQIIQALLQSDPEWAESLSGLLPDTKLQSRCWNDEKITAHHAIIPTSAVVDVQKMSAHEKNLYNLIRQRYLMQFSPLYRYQSIFCQTEVLNHQFISHGHKNIDLGWRVLLKNLSPDDGDDSQSLSTGLTKGLQSHVVNAQVQRKTTKPPARYTSGSLIAAMKSAGRFIDNIDLRKVLKETSGIGTEATRAGIIEILMERDYLKKSGKYLVSTTFGRDLISIVPDVLKDPGTTALWEQVLDDIANNQASLESFIDKQKAFLSQMIQYLQQQQIEINYQKPVTPCPECSKPMRRIKSKNKGYFWSCTDYPVCMATLPDQKGNQVG